MSGTMRFISNLHKISFNLLRFQKENAMIKRRLLHSTVPLYLREVTETNCRQCYHYFTLRVYDKVRVKCNQYPSEIEGRLVESPREDYIIKADGEKHLCPLCRLNLDINYTDILIISQFVQEDGEIVPRQITGLCYPQHARMKHLIHQAHSAGLMQNLRPHVYPVEYSQMSDHAWKKYNVYYNEAIDD